MAAPQIIAARRDEAVRRIDNSIDVIARKLRIDVPELPDTPVRYREVIEVERLERIADFLDEIQDESKPKKTKDESKKKKE